MTEDQRRKMLVIRAQLELSNELLAALDRGGEWPFEEGLPMDEIEGMKELARRIREGGYRFVLR